MFKEFEKDKSQSIENSEYLLCTGLFEKHDKDLNYYKDLLEKNIKKQMPARRSLRIAVLTLEPNN